MLASDVFNRLIFTLIAGALATLIVHVATISTWWAVPIAAGVTALRVFVMDAELGGMVITIDLAERAGWTALQAALAVVSVESFTWSPALVPFLATLLAALKAYAATQVGDPQTAATLPVVYDPSTGPVHPIRS